MAWKYRIIKAKNVIGCAGGGDWLGQENDVPVGEAGWIACWPGVSRLCL